MTSPFHSDGTQFAFDSTSLDLGETCLRKYYYRMKLGLVPKRVSVHLTFGAIYASALEHFFKYVYKGGMSVDSATKRVVGEALVASWGVDFDHPAKTRVGLIRSIVWYLAEFGDERDSAFQTWIKSDGTPAVEQSFRVPLTPEILLCGHIDRVVKFANQLYVLDNKTTGGHIGAGYFAQFDPDIQMSGYTYAGKIVFQSPVRGVIIDAAEIRVDFTRFSRGFTYRSPDKLAEYLDDTLYTIARINEANRSGVFPRNRTSCTKYSDKEGFGGCPYREICSAEPGVRELAVKSAYNTQKWNPMEPR